MSDEDEYVKLISIQLIVDEKQYDPKTEEYKWRLSGTLSVRGARIDTDIGVVEIGLSEAILRIEIQGGCSFDKRSGFGFSRSLEFEQYSESNVSRGHTKGNGEASDVEAKGAMGLLNMGLSVKALAKRSTEESQVSNHGYLSHLRVIQSRPINMVSFDDFEYKYVEWHLGSFGGPFTGTVFSPEDEGRGELGTLSSTKYGGFEVIPSIEIQPEAIVVDEAKLKRKTQMSDYKKALKQADKNKISVINALLKKNLIHTPLPSSIIPVADNE